MPPDNAPRTPITHDTVKMLLRGVLMPDEVEDAAVGDDLGKGFRLVERIGEGGFGVVWRAEQTLPVRREVAVKFVKLGMDSREVLVRFEQERQVLAAMEHPCITQIFDAGLTHDGRPYFVMELVRGLPLTQHVKRGKLPLKERLELCIELCNGVHHAHQKGVIHRDLKPSNVLVAEVDGRAVPKIIDFGIAKALTTKKLTSLTLVTRTGMAMGTPLYMAPEQLADREMVDTRSDVYALGALLYELLTDSPPFPVETLTAKGEDEMRRIIREVTPQRPSRRLTAQKLPSDLDWITLRALEKDPRRRYASAAELAADVERFLTDQPVLAHPPEWRYLTMLWVRRHRAACAAILISAAALISGTTIALWQAQEARRERNVALEHETAARLSEARATTSESLALKQKQRAEQTASFLSQLLEHAADEVEHGSNPQALSKALERSNDMLNALEDDPVLKGALLQQISRLHISMGDWENALARLQAYAETVALQHGPESEKALDARLETLKLMAAHGDRLAVPPALVALRGRIEKAGLKGGNLWFEVLREQVRVWIKLDESQKAMEASEEMMAAVTDWKIRGQTRLNARIAHAMALEFAGRYDEALALLEVCRITGIEEKAKESAMRGIERRQLFILEARGDHAGGAAVVRRRLDAMRTSVPALGVDHVVSTLLQLAEFESAAGHHDEAVKHGLEALNLANSPAAAETKAAAAVGRCLNCLAESESAAGWHEQALLHAQESRLHAFRSGKTNDLVSALEQLAWTHRAAGQLEEAFAVWQEACGVHEDDPNFKSIFYPLAEMAAIRHEQKRHAEAVEIIRDIWQRCLSHPLGAKDIGELGYTARLGLKYWAEHEKATPGSAPPAELAAWQKAEEIYRTQNSGKGRAAPDKGPVKPERVRKSDG
jgi:tetratricopeptide (TPR) repeat protein